jgi:hypothetical protein
VNDSGRVGGRAARVAISVVFLVNGITFASWMPRLPEIQDRLGISDAALGITLVGAGVGGLAASGLSGRLVDRFGSRTMTLVTSAGLSMALPLMGVAPTAFLVFSSLIVLGALDGLTDVAMNAQAVELQRRVGRSIITRFHALWSAGAVTGGIIASRAAAAGISLRTQLLITAAVLVATTLIAARWLLPDRGAFEHAHESAPSPGVSSRAIIGRLFLVGLAIALAEAPPNEWAALLMTDRFDVGPGAAGLGFVAVAGGMLVGRVVGDHVTGGAALAAVGVIIATLAPSPVGAGIGLFITGLGLSSLFPLLFRAASELTHGSHSGMAAFSSGARLGFLIASPLIGVLASGTSVAIAVLLVSGGAATAVALARLPRAAVVELQPDPL